MIHLVTPNPALDLEFSLEESKTGKIGRVAAFSTEAGGKALNVARFLKECKVPTITWMGTGGGNHPSHVYYRALLELEGLPVGFLGRQVPVRANVVINGRSKYNHAGFGLEPRAVSSLRGLVRKARARDLVVLTGSLPAGADPGLYAGLVRLSHLVSSRVAVDSSGKALKRVLSAKPWFLKVNLHELREALGWSLPDLRALDRNLPRLRRMGIRHGAVTNGRHGALLWEGESRVMAFPPAGLKRRSLVVGSGDGFLAGYLKAFQEGKTLPERARWACAFAACVAKDGIMGFSASATRRLLPKVKLRIL